MGRFNVTVGYMSFTVMHIILFALALAVCGLYGMDVQRGNEKNVHVDSKWVRWPCFPRNIFPTLTFPAGLCCRRRLALRRHLRRLLYPLHLPRHRHRCASLEPCPLHSVDHPLWCLWQGTSIVLFTLPETRLLTLYPQLFINEDPEGDGGIKRMKNAVWVDLVSALLWLATFIASFGYWWKHRDVRTRFTGRARV